MSDLESLLAADSKGGDSMNEQQFPRRNSVHFLLKDPHWTFVWWDLTLEVWNRALAEIGAEMVRARFTLRVYDVTGIAPDS